LVEYIDCVVPDILGHTVDLVVEHCKIVAEGCECMEVLKLHTVEADTSPVMAGDKVDLAAQSLDGMAAPWAMSHRSLENCHIVGAGQEQHIS
jgi:hypothetical protein